MADTQIHSFKDEDSFAAFSLPGIEDHFLFVQDTNGKDSFVTANDGSTGFYIHPFIVSKASKACFIKADIIQKNARFQFKAPYLKLQSETSKATYEKMAGRFIQAIETDHQKLVLSRIKKVKTRGKDLFETFISLKESYPKAFVYIFHHPECGCWMGASPEIFYNVQKSKAITVALAGTKLNTQMEEAWSEKNIREQQIVSHYIKTTLESEQIHAKIIGPKDQVAGNVIHIQTEFHFKAPGDPTALLDKLHPTPAVCGIPKEKAQDFILANEHHRRYYYTGYLGPVNFEQSTMLFVNLRCMQCAGKEIVLYLGGGIVEGSDPESEWNETENKAQTLLAVLK